MRLSVPLWYIWNTFSSHRLRLFLILYILMSTYCENFVLSFSCLCWHQTMFHFIILVQSAQWHNFWRTNIQQFWRACKIILKLWIWILIFFEVCFTFMLLLILILDFPCVLCLFNAAMYTHSVRDIILVFWRQMPWQSSKGSILSGVIKLHGLEIICTF